MSRSYNKVAGGTWGGCRSRKKGKQACHRKFRRNGSYSSIGMCVWAGEKQQSEEQ